VSGRNLFCCNHFTVSLSFFLDFFTDIYFYFSFTSVNVYIVIQIGYGNNFLLFLERALYMLFEIVFFFKRKM